MSRKDNRVLKDFEPTLTKQSFKDECNINNIVAKYMRTGQITHLNSAQPRYIDCVGVSDYQAALELIDAATAEFAALPAKIRARFGNDPLKLIAFCEDPNNRDEAIKLGLIPSPDVPMDSPIDAKKAPQLAPEQAVAPKA